MCVCESACACAATALALLLMGYRDYHIKCCLLGILSVAGVGFGLPWRNN